MWSGTHATTCLTACHYDLLGYTAFTVSSFCILTSQSGSGHILWWLSTRLCRKEWQPWIDFNQMHTWSTVILLLSLFFYFSFVKHGPLIDYLDKPGNFDLPFLFVCISGCSVMSFNKKNPFVTLNLTKVIRCLPLLWNDFDLLITHGREMVCCIVIFFCFSYILIQIWKSYPINA